MYIYVYICIFPIRIYLPTYPKMFNGFNEHILSGDLVCWIGLGDRLYFLGGMSQSVCSIPNANMATTATTILCPNSKCVIRVSNFNFPSLFGMMLFDHFCETCLVAHPTNRK